MTKCAECGYLAVRIRTDQSLGEASKDFRDRGAVPNRVDEKGYNQNAIHEVRPLCFVIQPYLQDAIGKIDKNKNENEQIKAIMQAENNCTESTRWQQGFTPKEHRVIDTVLKWQSNESKENRKWRFREFLIAVVALVVVVVASVIGALIERGAQPTINITTTDATGVTIEK